MPVTPSSLRSFATQLAGLGQRDDAAAAPPVDEAHADGGLERRDLLADRRLRVAEHGAGAAERALAGDRLECGEVPELDPRPTDGHSCRRGMSHSTRTQGFC